MTLRRSLQTLILTGVLFGISASAVHAAPTLSRVEQTAEGYKLMGSGFGKDKARVQVFEGASQVAATAIVSVADTLIDVRSKPTGTVQLKVKVGGRESGVVSFTPAAVRDAAKAKAEEDAKKKAVEAKAREEAAAKQKAEAQAKARAEEDAKKGPGVASVSVVPASVVGGTRVTGTVTLTGPAPAGGAVVFLTRPSGSAATTFPGQVTVVAGQPSATFEITTPPVTAATTVTIGAKYGGVTQTATLSLTAAGFQPKSVTTGELTMTGLRFQPKSVTTGELTMTGLRE